jgi:branched-chain amino acid transport system permease protein
VLRLNLKRRALEHPQLLGGVLVLILAIAFPYIVNSQYWVTVGYQVGMMMTLALGLNIVVGYAGLLDLGFAAFFAIGAYTTGILSTHDGWSVIATIPVGIVVAVVGALFVGIPTLRLRSDYLAVVTLGFGEIIQALATNLSVTGGASGIFDIPPLQLFGITFVSGQDYYYAFLVLVVICVLITLRIRKSRIGRAWLCIREDEDAAQAMGIKTYRYKLYAYAGGAVFGAAAGSLFAPALSAISPTSFSFSESLLFLMAVAIGGMGSVLGALLGATAVEVLPELLRSFSQARLLVFGAVLVLMMILRPHGLLPEGAFSGLSGRLPFRRSSANLSEQRPGVGDDARDQNPTDTATL